MTDQTTTPAPARRPGPEDVWARLLGDSGAFVTEHAGPTLGHEVALLLWEAAVLGHAQGVRDAAGRTREQLLAVVPDVAFIVERAMRHAQTDAGATRYPTLHRLAHAGRRAREAVKQAAAAYAAAVEKPEGGNDGG